jgi:hypothetical protein
VTLLATVATLLAATLAAGVDESQFRYTRALGAAEGVPVSFEPDGPMYAHARVDFPDVRVLDARGEQVPWRPMPLPAEVPSQPVELVARGRRDGVVTVVVDRGAVRPVIDRLELDISDRVFTGTVVVQGSNTGAEASYAVLSSTPIYSVRGAVDARSTTAVFPPTDYRHLLVQARGVSDITGARVARDPRQAPLEQVAATERSRERRRATVVRLDLGYANVPVDAVVLRSRTPRYVRQVTIEGSNDGISYVPLGGGEIARFPEVALTRLDVQARHRYLRVTVHNEDDAPLAGLKVTAEARPRPLLLAEGYETPYRLLYGGDVQAPSYDFQRLPAAATGFEEAREGTLTAERENPSYEAPADTRTFFERNDRLVQVALVVAALVVAAAGVLALRRRA